MAITLGVGPVTGGNVTTGSTITLSLTGTTAGRAIVVGVAWRNNSHTISSITCSGESNLTLHGSSSEPSGRTVELASLANNTAGGDKTIVVTMSAGQAGDNYAVAFALELTGADAADFFDVGGGATGSSTTPTVSLTTTNDNASIVAICTNSSTGGDPAAGSGYTLITLPVGGQRNNGEYDVDVGTAGSKSPSFTITSDNWAMRAAAFNAFDPSQTVEPGPGSLTYTGRVAGVVRTVVLTPTAGSVTVTGYVPEVLQGSIVSASAGSLTYTGYTPSVVVPGATGSAAFSLLVHTLDAEGTFFGESGNMVLPQVTLSASGVSGAVGNGAPRLPVHAAEGDGNTAAAFDLLVHSLSASGASGTAGASVSRLPVHSVTADGVSNAAGLAGFALLRHRISASGVSGTLGTLERNLPLHRITASGYAGNIGTAAITLLAHTLTAAGYQNNTGDAAFELVAHRIEAAGYAGIADSFRGWAVNLRTAAITEYSSFAFNSFASFNGAYLAAGPGGIVVLGTQDLDGETAISARARTGSVSYGSSYLKRVPRLYVQGELPGSVYFRSITPQDGERTYLLSPNGITGDQQRRVPIGRGPKAVSWQFEIENIDGADFQVSRIMPYPRELRRRIS